MPPSHSRWYDRSRQLYLTCWRYRVLLITVIHRRCRVVFFRRTTEPPSIWWWYYTTILTTTLLPNSVARRCAFGTRYDGLYRTTHVTAWPSFHTHFSLRIDDVTGCLFVPIAPLPLPVLLTTALLSSLFRYRVLRTLYVPHDTCCWNIADCYRLVEHCLISRNFLMRRYLVCSMTFAWLCPVASLFTDILFDVTLIPTHVTILFSIRDDVFPLSTRTPIIKHDFMIWCWLLTPACHLRVSLRRDDIRCHAWCHYSAPAKLFHCWVWWPCYSFVHSFCGVRDDCCFSMMAHCWCYAWRCISSMPSIQRCYLHGTNMTTFCSPTAAPHLSVDNICPDMTYFVTRSCYFHLTSTLPLCLFVFCAGDDDDDTIICCDAVLCMLPTHFSAWLSLILIDSRCLFRRASPRLIDIFGTVTMRPYVAYYKRNAYACRWSIYIVIPWPIYDRLNAVLMPTPPVIRCSILPVDDAVPGILCLFETTCG